MEVGSALFAVAEWTDGFVDAPPSGLIGLGAGDLVDVTALQTVRQGTKELLGPWVRLQRGVEVLPDQDVADCLVDGERDPDWVTGHQTGVLADGSAHADERLASPDTCRYGICSPQPTESCPTH